MPRSYSGAYTIPDGIESIAGGAFNCCSGLTSVTIPNSVTSIGDYAFYECSALTSVTIPNSVKSIGEGAFSGCTGLSYIIVPSSVISIGEGAFNNVKEIINLCMATGAPWGARNIINGYLDGLLVYSDASMTNLLRCIKDAVGEIIIPNRVTTISDGAFSNCSLITSVILPNGLTRIGNAVFYDCTGLTSITIPNCVTSIGQWAFYGCSNLKNVIIGSSVKVLEEGAFSGCSSIKTITCYSMRPPTVNNRALEGLDYSTIVYVPADYLNTYKMHDAWGLYDVRPLGATTTTTDALQVTPTETTAAVTWPAVDNAATYELVIRDKSGNVVCTLIFNAQGQLTSIAFAPAAAGSTESTQQAGFSFTVTGLEEGTGYDLTITAKDAGGTVLNTTTQSFTTTGPTALDYLNDTTSSTRKVIENGHIYILLPDGRRYNADGKMIRQSPY